MEEVRLGVIGCGGMGRNHMRQFAEIPRLKFTAASDSFAANLKLVTEEYGVQGFESGEELLDSGLVDAVLIATPHYFHPQYSKAALERGIHALTEKPVSVTAKAAAEVNAVAEAHPELRYAVMFQQRTQPRWKRVKQIIESGQLGNFQRMLWVGTSWFRTQAYYDSGSWRATWEGEGGGVLLNQCPHDLDMLYWLLGSPTRIHAHVNLGKFHDIEVEDDVTAYWEYACGASAVFIATTGELPGSGHWEICGDRGKLSMSEGKIEFIELSTSSRTFIKESQSGFARPEQTRILIDPKGEAGHKQMTANFINAILDDEPLIAPAVQGLHSIEIANAMIMSGIQQTTVDIPMDRDAYDLFLKDLIEQSDVEL